ncbi:MAG: Do family serine endopeptidase [Bacteroidota bacterium]|nr:Do family serine endopeptidase [Bacteroidota bacterium]
MRTKRFFGMILIAAMGGFVALFAHTKLVDRPRIAVSAENPAASFAAFRGAPGNNPVDFTYAAEKSVHSVVHVKVTAMERGSSSSNNPFFDFFFGNPYSESKPQPVSGYGSGVIISNDGYIVTNNHVIESADEIEVTLNDKRHYKAEVVGRDPETDLAVIRIKEKDLPFITYGNSDELKIGEWVLAVGNPYNLTSTVTAGIVSAKARNLNLLSGGGQSRERNNATIESFIQTDAAVNPGNSGGALVNTRGELVGINTAIASPTGSYIGNSFAIPVTIVKKVVADLIEYGKVQRALLGVEIKDVDSELAKDEGLDKIEGVYVGRVREDGAAAKAGIKKGDVILSVNGTKVNSPSELQEQVSKYRPNDKVEIVINRENKEKQISVTLRNIDGNTKMVDKDEVATLLGAKFVEASQSEKSKLGIKNGVKVINVGTGKLRSAGVEKDFIIISVNNQPVNTVDDLKQIVSGIKGGVYIEGIYPNGLVSYYAFGI